MLAVAPICETWGSAEYATLADKMQALWSATVHTDLFRAAELQLTPRATLSGPEAGEFRATGHTLRQICKRLAVGLYPLLQSIAGYGDAAATPNCSLRVATELYNKVLGLRFDARLGMGYRAFWDLHDSQLIGVVGTQYVQYPNQDLLSLMESVVGTIYPALEFYQAWRVGRQLVLRFVSCEPAFTVNTPDGKDAWYGGLHVENEETGEYSVRISPILWHPGTDGYVLDARRVFRAAHTGQKFKQRLKALLGKAINKYGELHMLQRAMQNLVTYPFPIRFGQHALPQAYSELLLRLGVEQSWCRKLIKQIGENTILCGAEPVSAMELEQLRQIAEAETLPQRSAYDFLQQILYMSGSQSVYVRLQLEYTARQVLNKLREI